MILEILKSRESNFGKEKRMKTNHQLGAEIVSKAFQNFLTSTKKDYEKYGLDHLKLDVRDKKVVEKWLYSEHMPFERLHNVLRMSRGEFWQLPHFLKTAFEGYFAERYEKIKKEFGGLGDEMSLKEFSFIEDLLRDRQIARRFLFNFLCEELASSGMFHAEMSADVLRLCLEKQIPHM